MREGNIAWDFIPQRDGKEKSRPVLVLRKMPNGDFLVCGITTQITKYIPEFDEIIRVEDSDFAQTLLKEESLVRLSFLGMRSLDELSRSKKPNGRISDLRYQRLLLNLSKHIGLPLEN